VRTFAKFFNKPSSAYISYSPKGKLFSTSKSTSWPLWPPRASLPLSPNPPELLFYVVGLLSLIALSVLAFSTLGIQKNVTGDLTFIKNEGNVLGEVIASRFATFFFAAASIKLFSTNLGILDWVSRLTADSLKVSFLGESRFWSESKIYQPLDRERRGKGKARVPETRLGIQGGARARSNTARQSLAHPTSRRYASSTLFAQTGSGFHSPECGEKRSSDVSTCRVPENTEDARLVDRQSRVEGIKIYRRRSEGS
jgi:hypothetical protein